VRQLGNSARHAGDGLLGLLMDAHRIDVERSRRWSKALIDFMLQTDGNKDALAQWVAKWAPLGDTAIDAYCAALPEAGDAAGDAKRAAEEFRAGLGLGR
jgi:toluene monooxygenase system protein E